MNKLNIYLLTLTALIAMVFSSCKDTVDYHAVGAVEGEGVYFLSTQGGSFTVSENGGSLNFNVYRTYTSTAISAALDVTIPAGETSKFTVPTSVAFAAGEGTSTLKDRKSVV